MNTLRKILRAIGLRLITAGDRLKLAAEPPPQLTLRERAKLAQPLLTREQLAIVRTLAEPDRWQPDQPLTEAEAKAWGAVLASPIGQKIDVAMINIAQQEAQRVLLVTPDQLARQAGIALGYRTGWAMAKALSTLTAANGGNSEDAPSTASANLAHLAP